MIDLYRASAGSGKTYTLAKKYIWYFLTVKEENGKIRLRTDAELRDSARHILAVTFTNKATNEMQMRIVDSLFALAYKPIETRTDKEGKIRIIKPDYMQDFIDELNVSKERISEVSARGLAVLLENYSDFNVSTIDSFFQQVLRTFAYESDINDSYQVELDSAYLSQVSVDETLQEIDNNADDTDTPFWIKTIIERTHHGKWNIFSRSSNSAGENPYKEFIDSVKKMETEQYKLIRNEIEDYFRSDVDFKQLYLDLTVKYEKPVKDAFRRMHKAFERLAFWLPDELAAASSRSQLGKFAMVCRNIRKTGRRWDLSPASKQFPQINPQIINADKVQKWIENNPEEGAELRHRFDEAYKSYSDWFSLLTTPEFLLWRLYSVNLPYYALFSIVSRKRQEYLDEANAIELGETAVILKEVIGDSDTPFVYERMGTKLNHFLIDEFQDTSKLQWGNLSPLLHESVDRSNGNLIIGDAKQSIYRFRNADPSLITSQIPAEFGNYINEKGSAASDNTNYRSDLHIVRFNNSLFRYIARKIDEDLSESATERLKFAELYSNVVQTPNKTEDKGYVEIHFGEGTKSTWYKEVLDKLPLIVSDMLKRGYRQKDISVLVSTNSEGDDVIKAFVNYNFGKKENDPEIRFVSEQSLKVASSRGVGIITDVLANMARGTNPEIRKGEERRIKGVGVWADMAANFKFYQMQHPDAPVAEILESFFADGSDFNALSDLLSQLQSFAIPALVEAVTATFVPEDVRMQDAIYIAAFQDLVLEYCDSHPTDIGSFLKWWERRALSASVSSPEDTDAVQVVTIHKSKGLQYDCVIVPFADWDMTDVLPVEFKREWLWITPGVIEHDTLPLPPYMPVETSEQMYGTIHESLLESYFDLSKMDRLNAAYVAFTRAKRELIIFCMVNNASLTSDDGKREINVSSPKKRVGQYVKDFLLEDVESDFKSSENRQFMLSPQDMKSDVEGNIIRIGKITTVVRNGEDKNSEISLLKKYKSFKTPEFISYRDGGMPDVEVDPEDENIDLDPRSEGNIKHATLELVEFTADLPVAVRHLCTTGLIPDSMAAGIESSLHKALESVKDRGWFDGTARIVNERPVLQRGRMTRRPDRLMIFKDGHAEVVDYKFGSEDLTSKYAGQISRYVRLLKKTGSYTYVKGYIWYVNLGKIIEI